MTKNEIAELLNRVVEARAKTEKNKTELDLAKKINQDIKIANDSRIAIIQEENRKVDSILAEKEHTLEGQRREIETLVYEARAKLLRRIVLCNLKNLVPQLFVGVADVPENLLLSVIYKGSFAVVYDEITVGDKPVNSHEYRICVKTAKNEGYMLETYLKVVWQPTYAEIHHSYWSRNDINYLQRDFPSEEKAKAYAERNRIRLTEDLIAGIKQVEKEVSEANSNINEVFDFRLITDTIITTSDRERDTFKIDSASKHVLVLSPVLSNYERNVDKIQPYQITVAQHDNVLTFSGHRYTGQARDVKTEVNRYFNANFKAVEADTGAEILERRNF